MKFSDSVKALLLATIDELAADPEKYAKRPGRDFSRNRKLSFKQLLLMFLTMERGMHQGGNLHVFWPFHRRPFQNSPL